MPHFHLNVFDDSVVLDEEGVDLPDLATAMAHAVRGAREMIAADVIAGKPIDQSYHVEIADRSGHVLKSIRYGDMVQIKP